jgi:holo-[acyl-carrier protein] synthase
MILGIGTDLIETARIEQKLQSNHAFKQHVFSENEIKYCENTKKPFMHFAARWAVKEAFLKAFGVQYIGNHKLHEIETQHENNGKPFVHLIGLMNQEFTNKYLNALIHVSITHTEKYAQAFVIIEMS